MPTATDTVRQETLAVGNRVPVPAGHGLRVGDCVRQTLACSGRSRLPAFAGNLAYRTLFACFPGLFTLFWLLEAVGGQHAVQSAVGLSSTALPHAAAQAVQQQFAGTTGDQARGALTTGAVVAGLTTLWALAAALSAAMEGLNVICDLDEGRPAWQRYLVAAALGLGVSLLLLGALVLAVFGTAIARHLGQVTGWGGLLRWAWTLVSWPALVLAVLGAYALVYAFGPARPASRRWATRGALVATLLWLSFTLGFSVYINRLAAPTHTYGALAGIAVLMLYLYGTAVVLLLGAVIDRVLAPAAAPGPQP
jgi:membrane protein